MQWRGFGAVEGIGDDADACATGGPQIGVKGHGGIGPDRVGQFQQRDIIAQPVGRMAGVINVIRIDHRPPDLTGGAGASVDQARAKGNRGWFYPLAADRIEHAVRGRQHEVVRDQRTGAEPLSRDIQTPDTLPSRGILRQCGRGKGKQQKDIA